METVIFDVKMLLSQNNAPSDAFFLGALKHRDLRGQEVSSQVKRRQVNLQVRTSLNNCKCLVRYHESTLVTLEVKIKMT